MEAVAGGGKNFLHAAWDMISGRKQAPAPQSDCGAFQATVRPVARRHGPAGRGYHPGETNPAWDRLVGRPESEKPAGHPLAEFLPETSESAGTDAFPNRGFHRACKADGARRGWKPTGIPFSGTAGRSA